MVCYTVGVVLVKLTTVGEIDQIMVNLTVILLVNMTIRLVNMTKTLMVSNNKKFIVC